MNLGRCLAPTALGVLLLAAAAAQAGPPHPALAVGIGCYSCHPAVDPWLPTSRTGATLARATRTQPDGIPAAPASGPASRIESDLLAAFPSLGERLAPGPPLETSSETVGARSVSGLRAAPAADSAATGSAPGHPVFLLPHRYDEPFVARTPRQRVALRVLHALPARAEAARGHVTYAGAHEEVDSLHVPREGSSEEILLLRSEAAPRAFEYELLEMQGVSGVALLDGAVRFLAEPGPSRGVVPVGGTLEIARPWVVDARGVRSESAARWEVLRGDGGAAVRLRLVVDPEGLTYPLAVDPSFTITGTMSTVRGDHSATLLGSGKVLIAGGLVTLNDATATAELYDPGTGRFTPTGSLGTARYWHGASILPTGRVLLAGGFGTTHLASAELYDPATGTFSPTGPMTTPRAFPLTVLLSTGKVLVAGGFNGTHLVSAELYDPATGTFSPTGSMTSARFWATATRLKDGRVLVAGGFTGASHLATAEIYNPATGLFTAVPAPMTSARSSHVAALLPDGRVFLAEGFSGDPDLNLAYPASGEIFDPATGLFTATSPLLQGAFKRYVALLPNGDCLLAGGVFANLNGGGLEADSLKAQLYRPDLDASVHAGVVLNARRLRGSATLLPNGAVLFVGGFGHSFVLQPSAEEYRPGAPSFSFPVTWPTGLGGPFATLGDGRIAFLTTPTARIYDGKDTFTTVPLAYAAERATLLPDGRLLLSGEFPTGNLVLWDPATGATTPTGQAPGPTLGFTATLLRSGRVLLAGGSNRLGNGTKAAMVYDPATGNVTPVGPMSSARGNHAATLLEDGRVLVTGGASETVRHASAEIFDPATGSFTLLPRTMAWPRELHEATLLPGGRVLITGGDKGLSSTGTAEIFDPATSTFTLLQATMSSPRDGHTATLMPSGRVLIAGGENYPVVSGTVTTVEVFDPATGLFQPPIGQPASVDPGSAAGLLPDGRVLLFEPNLGTPFFFDEGLGFPDARRPVVASAATPLAQPAPLVLSGSGFKSPVVQLQRVEGEQRLWPLPDPSLRWSDASFTSRALVGLPAGHYRATVFADAVPSLPRFVSVSPWDPAAPSILGQPQPRTVLPGGTATLSVVAAGAPTLSYQWSVETAPGAFSPISGATASTLVTGALASRSVYRVTVSNGSGSVASVPAVVSVSSDSCANATTIVSVPYVGTQTTTSATSNASDPVPPCGGGVQSNSAWYRYTPPTDGVLTANTFESDYDTVLSAWTGSCGGFVPVAGGCNDNFISERSLVSFPVKAGTAYAFMVSARFADGGDLAFALDLSPTPSSFYTLPPCRVIDTRLANGPLAGPNLLPSPAPDRVFPVLASTCGVPAGARALAVNVTVAGPTAPGSLSLYPASLAAPGGSTINFRAGQIRANNAIVMLSNDGLGNLAVRNGSAGAVPFLLDVVGYFR